MIPGTNEQIIVDAFQRIQSNDLAGAERVLEKIRSLTAKPQNLCSALGFLDLRMGEVDSGKRWLQLELESFPNSPVAQELLSVFDQGGFAYVVPKPPPGKLDFPCSVKSICENRYQMFNLVPKGGVIAEIGVLEGDLSFHMWKRLQPRKMYLIDPWYYGNRDDATEAPQPELDARYIHVYKRFKSEIASGRIELIRAKSADAAVLLDDASLDFIYVDGDHTHQAVKIDLEIARAKTKAGGLIAVDDFAPWWAGVFDIVMEQLRQPGFWGEVECLTGNKGSSENILIRKR